MSFKDELDRASKEADDFLLRKGQEKQKRQAVLKEVLDSEFHKLSVDFCKQNDRLIHLVTSSNAVNLLRELRDECNLTITEGIPGFIQMYNPSSPAGNKIIVNPQIEKWYSRHSQKCQQARHRYNGFGSYVSGGYNWDNFESLTMAEWFTLDNPDNFQDLSTAISDYTLLPCYKKWLNLISRFYNLDHDFSEVLRVYKSLYAFIESPLTQSVFIEFSWNLRQTTLGGETFVSGVDSIVVDLNLKNVNVKRERGASISTPTSNFTTAWLKQQIANVFIKFPFF